MPDFAPEIAHQALLAKAPRILKFDTSAYPREWVSSARRTFKQLLGAMPGPCAPNLQLTGEGAFPGCRSLNFTFTSEPGADVPCTLLVPDGREKPPVVICLQGHSSGAHISLGKSLYPGDAESIEGDRDFALQAVQQGFAALVLEQRCFGQRRDRRGGERVGNECHHATMTALLLGRTMAGERVLDVSRAIDALALLPVADQLDLARIGIMGNSGGALISYYAAAMDLRISAVMPSCGLCTYVASIGSIGHCADNYVPGILQYFEMADLAGLIAPRPLVVVSGRTDPIFPLPGVEQYIADVREIYAWLEAPEKLRWVIGEGGHRFYADPGWKAFHELTGW